MARTVIQAIMSSRKGSVKTIGQFVDEFLLRSDILITSTYLQWEPRLYPIENLEASGTAGKLRLSKLYCSERREPSGRFSMGIAEEI